MKTSQIGINLINFPKYPERPKIKKAKADIKYAPIASA